MRCCVQSKNSDRGLSWSPHNHVLVDKSCLKVLPHSLLSISSSMPRFPSVSAPDATRHDKSEPAVLSVFIPPFFSPKPQRRQQHPSPG